jgi:hypothetical protein
VLGGSLVGALTEGASAGHESAVGAGAEEITLRLLYQLLVILVTTLIVTRVVRRLGQTDVSGEILAGLLLGPSLLGPSSPASCAGSFIPRRARSSPACPRSG